MFWFLGSGTTILLEGVNYDTSFHCEDLANEEIQSFFFLNWN